MSALTQPFLPGVALSNLLSNALKYSPGEELVQRFVSEAGSCVRSKVSDQGIELSDTDLAHIFDSGYLAPEARLPAPGSGRGLLLVQRCAEILSGDLSIQTSYGFGTEACFTIPKLEQAHE
jgi:signal transduction histidine kinase